jgi:CDP-2,3-bis-(O-geranylgeranyl)-sn-glycerol synthase
VLVVVLVLTPILHVGTNIIAYWLGFKNEPW